MPYNDGRIHQFVGQKETVQHIFSKSTHVGLCTEIWIKKGEADQIFAPVPYDTAKDTHGVYKNTFVVLLRRDLKENHIICRCRRCNQSTAPRNKCK